MNFDVSVWAQTMMTACIHGSLIILWICLLCRFAPALPSSVRAMLWWLASIALLADLFLGFPVPLPTVPMHSLPETLTALAFPHSQGQAVITDAMHEASAAPISVVHAVFLAWLAGALIWLGMLLVQVIAVVRILRKGESLDETPLGATARCLAIPSGLHRPPRLIASEQIVAPLTANPFNPCILLPTTLAESLGDAEIEMILAHELAHVRRGDLLLAIPVALAQVIFWFLPPLWYCIRAWDTARETACDETAIRITGSVPASYAALLLKVVEADARRLALPVFGVTASFHTLKERLARLPEASALPAIRRPVASLLLLVTLLLAVPWRVTAGGEKEEKGNLVVNGGFEQGTDTPNGWFYGSLFGMPQVEVARDTEKHHSGSASLRFTKTAPTFAPVALLSQTLPVAPAGSKKIRIRTYIRAMQARKATLAVMFQEADGSTGAIIWGAYVGESNPGDKPVTHDWRMYEKVLPLPAGTRSVTLALEMYGSGTVWFDDVFARYEK